MPHNMMLLYFRLPYFHVSDTALFSALYFSTLILYRHSLDTFYMDIRNWNITLKNIILR